MKGKVSFLTPDIQPMVGKSIKFKNLYYNLGMREGSLENYIKSAELVKEELVADIL